MNYSEMSDFDINVKVARALGCKIKSSGFGIDYYFTDDDKPYNVCAPHGPIDRFNPCNSWHDSGPIIESNKISIQSIERLNGDFGWLAKGRKVPSLGDDNPLRAAMIVFLMMKEGEK